MKNNGRKLLFKYITMGFLTGAVILVSQLFILSGYVSRPRLAQLLMSSYTHTVVSVVLLFFVLLGFLIARFKIHKHRLHIQLMNAEDEKQVLQLELSDYQYALELCAITTIIDENGKIKKVNNHFLNFTGYKATDILGRSVWRLPSSLQKPGMFDTIKEAINKGQVWEGEIEYYQSNGNTLYTKAAVVPLLLQDKDHNDCLVIQYDITAQKNIDLALKKSEKEKSIILSNAQTLICTHDLNGIIININKAGADMLDQATEEIIGKPLQSFLDSRYSIDNYLADIRNKGISTGYMKIITKENRKRTLLYKNVACTEQGETYIIGSAIDISETLKDKKTIDNQKIFTSRLVDESSNLICVVDEEMNITFLNRKLKSFFNIDDTKNPTTLHDAQNRIPDFFALTGRIDQSKESTEKHSFHECKIAEPGTGLMKWFKVQKTVFLDNENKTFILIIATDISEKHAIQVELVKARQTVEASLKMRENFISNMSHEIRTPLNAIIGFSELLADTALNHKQADYLQTIKVAGQNLLNIINDILDLSKLESGNIQVSNNKLEVRTIVINIQKLFQPRILEKKIDLTVHVDNNVPQFLLGDDIKLNQILINLVSNAVKFTNHGKVEIIVTADPCKNNTANIQFTIKDSGIGIESDKLDVIFQRYSQASQDIHKLYGGTGLGLSISKSLVELLGGEIKLSSDKGVGTTFSFALPFNIPALESAQSLSHFVSENKTMAPLRILLAEDNNTNAKLATQVLKKYNHHVCHVKDGTDVLEILKTQAFDIILMDVQMPNMDGIEASKVIRLCGQPYCNIPIIALTAHSFKGEKNICEEAGMNAYLSKPYRPQELIDCISKTIRASNQKENILSIQSF